MSFVLFVLGSVLVFFLIGFWSTRLYPAARPFRYNQTSDVHVAEARQTMQHNTFATRHELSKKTEGCLSDSDVVETLADWVNSLWIPQPGRYAHSQNSMSIVSRASKGERFSRTDYAQVLCDALMAVNIPSRLVTLYTRDCVWRPLSSHYTGIEYYDRDHFKWVWLDAQYGLRIVQNQKPLNIMEIKEAYLHHTIVELQPDIPDVDVESYLQKIGPFMDIIVAIPMGQNKKFALIPPQLQLAKKKWLVGHTLYDIGCHSLVSFYASHPIKQLTRPSKVHPISIRSAQSISPS